MEASHNRRRHLRSMEASTTVMEYEKRNLRRQQTQAKQQQQSDGGVGRK